MRGGRRQIERALFGLAQFEQCLAAQLAVRRRIETGKRVEEQRGRARALSRLCERLRTAQARDRERARVVVRSGEQPRLDRAEGSVSFGKALFVEKRLRSVERLLHRWRGRGLGANHMRRCERDCCG